MNQSGRVNVFKSRRPHARRIIEIILHKEGWVHLRRGFRRVIYLPTGMKNHSRRVLITSAGLVLAMIGAALTHTIAVQSFQPAFDTRSSWFLQSTTTPEPEDEKDRSVVGSTDGIVVMGVVIVLIVAVPILVHRKHWMR